MATPQTPPPADLMALSASDIEALEGIAHRWRLCYMTNVEGNKIGVREVSALDKAINAARESMTRPSLSAQAVGEPVAWEKRDYYDGKWGNWYRVNRNYCLLHGDKEGIETRALYTTPPQPADGGGRVGELVEALRGMIDCCPCQNDCDPGDMTCATNAARAALAKFQPAGGES